MKKIFVILFVFVATATYAQGNLQMNQVLLLNSTLVSNTNLGTVPSGKIWKVESFGISYLASQGGVHLMLNGIEGGLLSPTSFQSDIVKCPIWLPAGTQLGFENNGAGAMIWFSIIEFNIVP